MSNMVVRTNIFALNAHRNMKNVGFEQGRASNRLSSGFRINSAADDAAGLAISENMRAQIRGLDQASRNAQDGQAMLLTTEGGLEEIGNMLQRVRELVVQAANDTNTQDQRTMIEQEVSQLATEIASMQQRVEFNTNRVLAMGPAIDIEIAKNIAKIDANNLILNSIADELNTNRASVADAREMLALFNNTDIWADLSNNTRLYTVIREALSEVDMQVSALGLPQNVQDTGWQVLIAGQAITDVAEIIPERITTTPSVAAVTLFGTGAGSAASRASMGPIVGTAGQVSIAAVATAQTAVTAYHTAGQNAIPAITGTIGHPAIPGGTQYTISPAQSGTVVTTPAGAVLSQVALSNNMTVSDLIGLLNTRDTAIMNALGEVASVRTEMTLAGRNIITGQGDFGNSVSNFRAETSSGNFVAFFQVGANANQGISFDFENVSRTVSSAAATVNVIASLIATPSEGSGIGSGADITQMVGWVQTSLDDVNSIRANLGAVQNRMDYTMRSLDISSENLSDSESRVRNADVAREMMRFTMANVLQQAAVSMLAQANQMPNNLLQLLR